MKLIVRCNVFLINPPQSDAAVRPLQSDDPITAHAEPQEHSFNKKLTVCRTYRREAGYVPSSLLMVYAFMFTSDSLSSLFNFTSCFRATQIYFTTLTCHFCFVLALFSSLLSSQFPLITVSCVFFVLFFSFSTETHKGSCHFQPSLHFQPQ